jgi:predicted Zn finger-like uncharacterized protein
MFTHCPRCARQFRIHAEQIAAANGLVRCGFCGEQFNALERLHDSPLPETVLRSSPKADVPDNLDLGAEPQFDISIAENELAFDKLVLKESGSDEDINDLGVLFNDGEDTQPEFESFRLDEDDVDQHYHNGNGTNEEAVFDFPEELLAEGSARQRLTGRMLWGGATLFAAVLVVAQVAWFNRDELIYRYPELKPWVIQLCEKLDCELIRHRDIAAIKLLNRDVREHPRFVDSLLVNATMTNRSHGVQPFPHIQLVLFDTNGDIIGYREFRPDDYLDNSIGIFEGLSPNFPVHFVLEVTGPTKGAVSFEFRFL